MDRRTWTQREPHGSTRRLASILFTFAALAGCANGGGAEGAASTDAGIDSVGGDAAGTDAARTDAAGTDAGGTDAGGADAGGTDAGAADTTTGCAANADCGTGAYCHLKSCGGSGVCTDVGSACPQKWAPVCGCDNETHASACHAERAGTAVAKSGPCTPAPMWCLTDQTTCPAGSWCKADGCKPGATGTCTASGTDCQDDGKDVCGCDGKQYAGMCAAGAAGVNVNPGADCSGPKPGATCGGIAGPCGAGLTCDQQGCFAAAPGECVLPLAPNCLIVEPGAEECGCDDVTYKDACHRRKAGVSRKNTGKCKVQTGGAVGSLCGGKQGMLCQASLLCDPMGCGLDSGGVCVIKMMSPCPLVGPAAQQCGCDAKTFPSACERQHAGVGKAKDGPC